MPIDFKKKINKPREEKKTNPVEIYDNLDRTSTAGPLRAAQLEILSEWYSNHNSSKDLVIKLHTGEGKTLIGLLILLSKLNMGKGPCVYVCPNKYLVSQVIKEAQKFGIPVCTIGENNAIPGEFMECNRILIVHAHKLFNGKSIFGISNSYEKVGTIVIDDAHACLDVIRDSFVISIKRSENREVYNRIIEIFDYDLKMQGSGSYIDIKEGRSYDTIMPIPYWAWVDKKDDVLSILANHNTEDFIQFTWNLIKDSIEKCQAFVNGQEIQIVPTATPIEKFGSFYHADSRILMSATTQDDVFFIKSLDFSADAVRNPLISNAKRWSGEKMILVPSLIDETYTRELVIDYFCKIAHEASFGVVALVPTKKKQDDYIKGDCTIIEKSNIYTEVERLCSKQYGKIVVFANRYDGIDLPDNACRILLIDSMPFFTNMRDKYEELSRVGNSLVNKKIAQKIEQGIGRCVRSEKDYAVIVIVGAELVKFIRNKHTKEFFSKQTQKQVELGLQLVEWAREEETFIGRVVSVINQCLRRDEGWKDYYKSEMNTIESIPMEENSLLELVSLEREAEKHYLKNNYDKAAQIIQKIIDDNVLSESDKGWYLQEMARYTYHTDKTEATRIQKSAFDNNDTLLKPREGVVYKKIQSIDSNRIDTLKIIIDNYYNYEALMLDVETIIEYLSFGVESNRFEESVERLGTLLGFVSQRPDRKFSVGPDNLWQIQKGFYTMIECKNEVLESRNAIYKYEAGQMNNHCAWFEKMYPDAEALRIMIISSSKVSHDADFTHDVRIVTPNELEKLKRSFKSFYMELKPYDIHNLSTQVLVEALKSNYLFETRFMEKFSVEWKR